MPCDGKIGGEGVVFLSQTIEVNRNATNVLDNKKSQ